MTYVSNRMKEMLELIKILELINDVNYNKKCLFIGRILPKWLYIVYLEENLVITD